MPDYENSTHSAVFKNSAKSVRLLVYKNPEGWFYQLYDLDTHQVKEFPVSDWITGRTYAKQALEKYVGEKIEPLEWHLGQ